MLDEARSPVRLGGRNVGLWADVHESCSEGCSLAVIVQVCGQHKRPGFSMASSPLRRLAMGLEGWLSMKEESCRQWSHVFKSRIENRGRHVILLTARNCSRICGGRMLPRFNHRVSNECLDINIDTQTSLSRSRLRAEWAYRNVLEAEPRPSDNKNQCGQREPWRQETHPRPTKMPP